MLLRLAENGDMRALQVDVGVSGWMCLLVVYNFCDDCRLAYRARSESRGVGFCTWNNFMATGFYKSHSWDSRSLVDPLLLRIP